MADVCLVAFVLSLDSSAQEPGTQGTRMLPKSEGKLWLMDINASAVTKKACRSDVFTD